MQLGLGAIHEVNDEILQFVSQLGIPNIIVHTPELAGASEGYWEFPALLRLRTRVEAAGIKLYAIENVPNSFMDKIRLGAPGRDEQIDKMQKTVRNIGRAGIHVLGYHFMLNGVWRTEYTPKGRGGAKVTIYNHDDAKNAPVWEYGEITDEQMWDNITYFLKAIIPVAEQEGVMMSLHPDDPPISPIAGCARIIRSLDAYRRMLKIVDSPANGLEFCQGTVSEMPHTPEEIYAAIDEFVRQGKISYVHFRDVDRTVPHFAETFIDNGRLDMFRAMKTYYDAGYKGVFIADHTPGIVGDTPWGHRGRAYAMGYMKAMMKVLGVKA